MAHCADIAGATSGRRQAAGSRARAALRGKLEGVAARLGRLRSPGRTADRRKPRGGRLQFGGSAPSLGRAPTRTASSSWNACALPRFVDATPGSSRSTRPTMALGTNAARGRDWAPSTPSPCGHARWKQRETSVRSRTESPVEFVAIVGRPASPPQHIALVWETGALLAAE